MGSTGDPEAVTFWISDRLETGANRYVLLRKPYILERENKPKQTNPNAAFVCSISASGIVAAALTALLIVMYLCMYSLANKDRKKIESQM